MPTRAKPFGDRAGVPRAAMAHQPGGWRRRALSGPNPHPRPPPWLSGKLRGAAGMYRRAVPSTVPSAVPAGAARERDGGAGTSPSSRRWKIKLLP